MRYDLIAIGNPVYDLITTPMITTNGRTLSGCSTNACLAAKRLGMQNVRLVGNVGLDFSERFSGEMKRYGIDIINTGKGLETTGFSLKYDRKGDRTLRVIGNAGEIPITTVWRECQETRYLLLAPVLYELNLDSLIELTNSTETELFLDPQGLLRRLASDAAVEHFCDTRKFRRLVSSVDFIKPNELEANVITGLRDCAESARVLVQWGARAAIVTLGENGSVACDRQGCLAIPAYKTTAVDPTGAGDVYAGAFLAEYGRTGDLGSSCLYASAAASVMVESIGPDFAVNDQEVRRRAQLIGSKVRPL